jgi:uncharacterized protein with FMN-binding domain
VIPKRAVAAIVTTILGLVLLFSFKTPSQPATAASASGGVVAVGQPSASPTVQVNSGAAAAASPTAASEPTAATAAPSAAATPTPATATANGQYSGDVVNTRYGPVQVQVTISNGKIVDVTALQLPSNDPHSAQISQYVEPILRSSALQAQSAQVDMVSGATYTSDAYVRSLQAALDQAGM